MEYRQFGRTGVQVSPFCLGCMNFGGRTDEKESIPIIEKALDAGINFLDTANVYSRGRSEEVVGNALKQSGKRERVFLATKVHGQMDESDPNMHGNHRRHIIQQCEASLKRLQTDYIDLYQIHRPDSSVPIDETLRALDDLVRAGKIRYFGTSTFAAWQVVESLWVSKELGLNRTVSEQPPYHLLDRRVERELLPMARTYGLAVIPWSPLAGGFLTGKYKREEKPEEARWTAGRGDKHFVEPAFKVMDVVRELAKAHDCTPLQISLAWCRDQPGVTSPIIGPRTMEQLDENLGALEVTLSDEDRERLNEVSEPLMTIVPYGDADFGPHEYRW